MTDRPSTSPHAGDEPANASAHVSRGQILVMFAIMLTSLLGALGLAVDLGVAFSQRRTMQSAADAGALAGTRLIAKTASNSLIAVQSEVEAIVLKNTMALGSIGSINCNYVNDGGDNLGSCVNVIPTGASGVDVTVDESHSTFFIRVVPGGPDSVTTSATARANVKMLSFPTDGPYLPCGVDTQLAGGGTFSMVEKVDGQWQIRDGAVDKTYVIHGPQIEKCDSHSSRYKGLAQVSANVSISSVPAWFTYKEGDSAGLISEDVEGPDGCKAGQEVINCVVFLPIVVNDPEEVDNNRQQWCVAFAPFYITKPKDNETWGKLMQDYMVYGRNEDGSWGWHPGFEGPITIRLTK
jgi:Flp pilus assembly protein TadG